MIFLEQSERQKRQYIDAEAVFTAWEEARLAASQVRGSMFWRKTGSTQYLIRTSPGGAQKSLGPMNDTNRDAVDKFTARKNIAEARLKSLTQELRLHEKMNRALRVGRAPSLVIDAINAIENAGLGEHFVVVGTHALYAYESACGVLIPNDAMATQDIDLLLDTRKRIKFFTKMKSLGSSFLGILQKVDKTFKIRDEQKYTAVNDKGFEVDVIRRNAGHEDPHPLRLSDDEDDFWAVQVSMGNKMLSSRSFQQVVVATTGSMARMHTIHPLDFARIKRELSALPNRETHKYKKDLLQADLVTQLVTEYLPHLNDQGGAPSGPH